MAPGEEAAPDQRDQRAFARLYETDAALHSFVDEILADGPTGSDMVWRLLTIKMDKLRGLSLEGGEDDDEDVQAHNAYQAFRGSDLDAVKQKLVNLVQVWWMVAYFGCVGSDGLSSPRRQVLEQLCDQAKSPFKFWEVLASNNAPLGKLQKASSEAGAAVANKELANVAAVHKASAATGAVVDSACVDARPVAKMNTERLARIPKLASNEQIAGFLLSL